MLELRLGQGALQPLGVKNAKGATWSSGRTFLARIIKVRGAIPNELLFSNFGLMRKVCP